jgi:tight adherence protein C
MPLTLFAYPILSLALIGGGVALIVHASEAIRRLLAARVDLIARPADGRLSGAPKLRALVKTSAAQTSNLAVVEFARLARRLNIDPARAPRLLMAARAAAAAVLGLAGLALARHLSPAGGTLALAVGLAAVAAGAGWVAPTFFASYTARRRTALVVAAFPEALELMVVCVEAGIGLEESIDRAAAELGPSQPELAAELAQTSADMKILPDRDQALRNMAERTQAPSVRSVMTSLSQTLRYGTPLAQALRVAASELRNESLLQLEERANRLPTLLTLPMMLFIMPTILLVVGGPAMIRVIDAFHK